MLRGISWPLKMRPSKNPIRHTGLSIISTLNQSDAVRRDLATDLLLRSQRPIKQIAAEVGFQNEKSFMRAFKSCTGVTPEGMRFRGQ